VAAGQLGLTGGAQPIFPKSTKNKYTTTFGSPTAQEIFSNYFIRRWSFLFITNETTNTLHLRKYFVVSFWSHSIRAFSVLLKNSLMIISET
jgi:hypothetical protein